ncbi:glycosyltransferase [Microbacterium sp. BK668]|uniref:glycosyltransferase n=1 Tax=Microbacterium sp. BK668 TaxID=2512118 RepID=UPI0010614ECD|nr:glycosyltransferase [Microbacterium sp. BK668]TDN87871.1 glycosyltransferase involved in cell wall biosynthesis [Microbacterium sp. BK668]
MLLELGPRRYVRHRKAVVASRRPAGVTFGNGVTTALTPERAAGWLTVDGHAVVVLIDGDPQEDAAAWARRVDERFAVHFLVSASTAERLGDLPSRLYSVTGQGDGPEVELASVRSWMHQWRRRWDLFVVDASQPLPDPDVIVQLQHAAYVYHDGGEVGFVTPAYSTGHALAAGYDIDRRQGRVVPAVTPLRDYGQAAVPRYVLTAARHAFYATSDALDRVDLAERSVADADFDTQIARLVRHGWAGNIRTLCFSSAVVRVHELPALRLAGEQRRWALDRLVRTAGGATRVVFVLNATSISGGIRAVFEIANGLAERGFEVEIWSLEGEPTWFDLHVPVRTYTTYEDLLLSLRNVDAIKVATWWETAQVVWLASVNHGIPVYLIQEFETWFYPNDAVAQAAVVSSYRREFASLTEASYQVEELAEIGIEATLIPHGFDPKAFHVLPDWTRRDDAVLALGRSFFQKNFAMTERAWRALGEERPTLMLFGTEPGILVDERVEYSERPRDAQVNELYNSATIFVQTSRHEGFCLPVLEAMAAGCPVITTDSHGNRDFCRDGENSVFVAQDDAAGLAAAIRGLMNDPAERDRLRENGLRTAAQYAWPVVLDRVAAFYSDLALSASQADAVAEPVVGARRPATEAPVEPADDRP